MNSDSFFQQVYKAVSQIPCGKVTTYGQIAAYLGNPKASRQVGWALHVNPTPIVVPCHRVVFKTGSLAKNFGFGGRDVQRSLLEAEGVEVDENYSVDLSKYGWRF